MLGKINISSSKIINNDKFFAATTLSEIFIYNTSISNITVTG